MNYSPWPAPGEWFRAELRPSYFVTASYGGKWPWWTRLTGERFRAWWGRWPFLSVRNRWFGFYVGWKPINLADSKFDIPADFPRSASASEFSIRLTWGETS